MAMLLGGARLLKERERELRGAGTVKIVFQPAEEGGAGAAKMLSEGTLSVAGLLQHNGVALCPRYDITRVLISAAASCMAEA